MKTAIRENESFESSLPPQPMTLAAGQVAKTEHVTLQTVLQWMKVGIRVGSRRIRLHAIKIGGRWRTSPEDLAEFRLALNPQNRKEMRRQQRREQRQLQKRRLRRKEHLVFFKILDEEDLNKELK